LAVGFEPEMLDGQSNALKTHNYSLVSNKKLSRNMALGIGAQGLVTSAKNAQTYLIMTTTTNTQNPKPSNIFNTLAPSWFWRFSQKKQQFSVALPMN